MDSGYRPPPWARCNYPLHRGLGQPPGSLDQHPHLDADPGERNNLADKFPEKLNELKGLLDEHKEYLQKGRRPPAFVENPKELLTDTEGVPTLAEYMGRDDIQVMDNTL